MSSKRGLLIFSKSADPGAVKTRLRNLLTEDECLSLHLALLQDTLSKARAVDANPFLYLSGSQRLPFTADMPVIPQLGTNLGERMKNAFSEMLSRYPSVVIIGTDCPRLLPTTIENAFAALEFSDLVLGPAEDGGYYLIGLSKLHPQVFEDVPWGTAEVFESTLRAARNLTVVVLRTLRDVDEPQDLRRIAREIDRIETDQSQHLRRWINALGDRLH